MQELTLAVVGIDFPNGNGSNRRSEIMMTLPGEPVELVPEPKNRHDSHAIAVIGPRGVQIGYVTAERAPYIGARIARGESVRAIFRHWTAGRHSSGCDSAAMLRRCRTVRRRRPRRHRVDRAGQTPTHTASIPMTTVLNGELDRLRVTTGREH